MKTVLQYSCSWKDPLLDINYLFFWKGGKPNVQI